MSVEFDDERLDSPLVVHKITDASYVETANKVEVEITHSEENNSTLERHRFKKVKKKKKWPYFLIIVVIIVAVICGLYYGGVFGGDENKNTTAPTKESTTSVEDRFKNVITVKGTYIFFEGEEVEGINGLTRKIKYLDPSTPLTVQDESADPVFISEEVLALLDSYGLKYETKYIISSGLISKYETTAAATTASTTAPGTSPQSAPTTALNAQNTTAQ